MNIIDDIIDAAKCLFNNENHFKLIKGGKDSFESADGLIFFKPEISCAKLSDLYKILQYFFNLSNENQIYIDNIYLLKSNFIYQRNIFQQIYNSIYDYALLDSNEDQSLVSYYLGNNLQKYTKLIGGVALQKYGFSEQEILEIWKNSNISKIQQDMYCCEFINGKDKIALINGFVPNQLQAYNCSNKFIILFTFKSANSFQFLKNNFQGNIDSNAKGKKTMRQFFYDFQYKYKIDPIFQSRNGIHISENIEEGRREVDIFRKHIFSEEPICQLL